MEQKITRPEPLYQQVYKMLRQSFLDPTRESIVKKDEKIIETKIAKKLGISRTPVREAIRKLEMEGFVVKEDEGVKVNIPCRADISEAFTIKSYLEGLAVNILATNNVFLQEIEEILDREEELKNEGLSSNNISEMIKLDHQFHKKLIIKTENKKLLTFYEQLEAFTTINPDFYEEPSCDHRKIYQAILDKKPSLAEDLIKEHNIYKGNMINTKISELNNKGPKPTPTKKYMEEFINGF